MGIRTAIVGAGNCASSLAQAVVAARTGATATGVAHNDFGGYGIGDIEIVAAFDVDARKVRRPLHEALLAEPNCTTQYVEVPASDVVVNCGPLLDGVSDHMRDMVEVSDAATAATIDDVSAVLRAAAAEVVVLYLPVGSQAAAEAYARAALDAGCALVNCTPAKLAITAQWTAAFRAAGLPLLGDDVKSHIGSTTLHRVLIDLLELKGLRITQTHQLNIGGNTDFRNMRNPGRAVDKKHTKEAALRHLFSGEPALSVGPSDYVPHLRDHKQGFISIQGEGLLGMPFSIDVVLKVEDSPNSAGVVVDAVRAARIARDRGLAGPVNAPCAWLFKNPPVAYAEPEIAPRLQAFIAGVNDLAELPVTMHLPGRTEGVRTTS